MNKDSLILRKNFMAALSRIPLERWVFYLLLLAAVAPVWSGRFFVTGDGPCHVYNARVLLDYMQGKHFEFYNPFYTLNTNFEPNWFGHLWLAAFQLFFVPETAERVFLTGYVLLFGLGFRYLVRQINPDSVFLSSFGLLFVWHHLLQAGFYNYASSIALFFWVCGYWLHNRHRMNALRGLAWAGLWLALYSAHPMGLVFAGAFVGSAVLADALAEGRQHGAAAAGRHLGQQVYTALLPALPMLVLFAEYIYRKPWPNGANTETFEGVSTALVKLTTLITMNSTERDTVQAVAYIAVALALGAVAVRVRARRWVQGDFVLLFLGIALWQYFRQAGAKSLELLMPLRVQIFPWLGLLLWTATANFPRWMHRAVPAVAALLLGILLWLRIPTHRKASALVEDYMTCIPHIADSSVVLVLNYDLNGRDPKGKEIGNRIYLFGHCADYIGAYRTAIMSDNYEALRYYFPMIWRWERDMFRITDKEGMNFDNNPPRADILGFKQRSGGFDLNYVLLLSYDERHYDHQYSREIISQLEQGYDFIHGSPGGKAGLWRLKNKSAQ